MYQIDRQKFGPFVAELRKAKGITQKELAQQLFISDKAISKWETGVSIPDTALLIPLSELLGVSVTELLLCERMKSDKPLDASHVESLVKAAVTYSDDSPARRSRRKRWGIIYAASVLTGLVALSLHMSVSSLTKPLLTALFLGAFFGAYFCFFAKERLPAYHDEHRIGMVRDSMLRMNAPGLIFNNANWPYILLVGKIWSCACAALFPLLSLLMHWLLPGLWAAAETTVFLILGLGGLILPLYIVAKKYE